MISAFCRLAFQGNFNREILIGKFLVVIRGIDLKEITQRFTQATISTVWIN
jgi:hypothetical protein